MRKTLEEHLVNYLTDAYSIEQQALAQLRTAPRIAGHPLLQSAFEQHLTETESQASLVRERLEAHGGSPKRVQDAVMALGGKGFILFARSQPDTPGKLAAHAYSYEALEWASYEMLMRMAERAGDRATAAAARTIRDQERTMLERLERGFDAAVEASLRDTASGELDQKLRASLADAHALEAQSIELLEKGDTIGGHRELERLYADHLRESGEHARWVDERLDALGGDHSSLKDSALRMAGMEWGFFFQAQRDTPGKLAAFIYAVEHLEIAGYELLRRVAQRAGDQRTLRLVDRILPAERAMAGRVAAAFDRAFEASLQTLGAPVSS
jgi:ferritin-like metal-binding protein YciE